MPTWPVNMAKTALPVWSVALGSVISEDQGPWGKSIDSDNVGMALDTDKTGLPLGSTTSSPAASRVGIRAARKLAHGAQTLDSLSTSADAAAAREE